MIHNNHEIIQTNNKSLSWVYLHSINRIVEVPNHWHRSIEIVMVLKGSYNYYLSGNKKTIKLGDILIINSGILHSCDEKESDSDAISLIIPYVVFCAHLKDFDSYTFKVKNEIHTKYLAKVLLELAILCKKNDSMNYLLVNSLTYKIIYYLIYYFKQEKIQKTFKIDTMKNIMTCSKIIGYIDKNFKNVNLNLSQVASYIGISKEHLCRFFSENTNMTVKEYIDYKRLSNAYQLLITTDYTIIDISLISGFTESRAFIKCFKNNYGITPQKYRKKILCSPPGEVSATCHRQFPRLAIGNFLDLTDSISPCNEGEFPQVYLRKFRPSTKN